MTVPVALQIGGQDPSLDNPFPMEGRTLDRRFGIAGTPKKPRAAVLSTAGDHAFVTPTTGKALRVLWVAFVPNSDNTVSNLVTVSLATSALTLYIGYALAHWEMFEGQVNEVLTVNTQNVQPVAVTVHYEEF